MNNRNNLQDTTIVSYESYSIEQTDTALQDKADEKDRLSIYLFLKVGLL